LGSLILTLTGLWAWNQSRDWDNEEEKRMIGKGEEGTRLTRLQARIFDLFDVSCFSRLSPLASLFLLPFTSI
jgi:hypothetical protein